MREFMGDLLLNDTPDGGDVAITDGLFDDDRAFNTAAYSSLFGGNKDDPGVVESNLTWWGNTLPGTAKNERMISRFQALIAGMPMSSKNIKAAENAALLDLAWFKDEGIADTITVSGRAASRNKFILAVEIAAHGQTIYANAFSLFWEAGIYGGV